LSQNTICPLAVRVDLLLTFNTSLEANVLQLQAQLSLTLFNAYFMFLFKNTGDVSNTTHDLLFKYENSRKLFRKISFLYGFRSVYNFGVRRNNRIISLSRVSRTVVCGPGLPLPDLCWDNPSLLHVPIYTLKPS